MNYYTDVFKKYAEFKGRASRMEFWMFALINIVVLVILDILSVHSSIISFIELLYLLAIIVPALALTVRRLHDTGRTGWWIFITLLPFIGALILIVFEVLDSQPGTNIYGPNPKEML